MAWVPNATRCSADCPRRELRDSALRAVRNEVHRQTCVWWPTGRPVDLYLLPHPVRFMPGGWGWTAGNMQSWRNAAEWDGTRGFKCPRERPQRLTAVNDWHHLTANATPNALSLLLSPFDANMVSYEVFWAFPQYHNATGADRYWQYSCACFMVMGELLHKLTPNQTEAATSHDLSGAVALLDYGHEWATQDFALEVQSVAVSCRVLAQRTILLHFNVGSMLPPKQVNATANASLSGKQWVRWAEPVLGGLSARIPASRGRPQLQMQQAYWQRYHYDLVSHERGRMPELCGANAPQRALGPPSAQTPGQSPQFLMLGGSLREWRLLVTLELERRGLLSKGRFSAARYPTCDAPDPTVLCNDPNALTISFDACRALLSDGPLVRRVCGMLPRQLDMDPVNKGTTDRSTAHELWREADYGIVFETAMGDFEPVSAASFVTEKVLKPMLNQRPFLLLGSTGILATLRALGFRTFEPAINESYDRIPQSEARLEAILREVERLARLSPSGWRNAWAAMSGALMHNAKHLYCGGVARMLGTHVLDTVEFAFESANPARHHHKSSHT